MKRSTEGSVILEDKVQLLFFSVSLGMQMDSILHLTFVHSRGIFVRVPLESKYLYWVTVCAQSELDGCMMTIGLD